MKYLGTILPNPKTEALADALADKQRAQSLADARRTLADCEERKEQGETRFYKTPSLFAVPRLRGGLAWFEIRTDGEVYAAR